MERYFYSKDGQDVHGPIALDDLQRMAAEGILPPDTQVCSEGTRTWEPITAVAPAAPQLAEPSAQQLLTSARPPARHVVPETANPTARLVTIGLIVFAICWFVSQSGNKTSTPGTSTESSNSDTSISDTSWDTVDAIYNLKSRYTDLQKDNEWNRFKGKRVKWAGRISSISQSLGSVTMQVKMNPDTFTSDVIVTLKDSERTKASQLRHGDTVTFVATLNRWGTLLPISMKDGEIVE